MKVKFKCFIFFLCSLMWAGLISYKTKMEDTLTLDKAFLAVGSLLILLLVISLVVTACNYFTARLSGGRPGFSDYYALIIAVFTPLFFIAFAVSHWIPVASIAESIDALIPNSKLLHGPRDIISSGITFLTALFNSFPLCFLLILINLAKGLLNIGSVKNLITTVWPFFSTGIPAIWVGNILTVFLFHKIKGIQALRFCLLYVLFGIIVGLTIYVLSTWTSTITFLSYYSG